MTTPEIRTPMQEAARHRISHASVAREDLARLVELLLMLADKQDGFGMSYEAPSYRGIDGERLNLYGRRAHAAYRLLCEGRKFADALLPASPAQAVTPTPASNFSADAEMDDAGARADASSILASIDPDDIGKLIDESAWDEDTLMSDDDRNDRQNEAAETAEAILAFIKDKLK